MGYLRHPRGQAADATEINGVADASAVLINDVVDMWRSGCR
jgi:hypothetical protein